MLREYRRFFERRVNSRVGMPRVSKKRVAVYNTWIARADNWEPDARYFLIYNLHLMLIAPIESRHSGFRLGQRTSRFGEPVSTGDGDVQASEKFDEDAFLIDLAADIDHIISASNEIAKSRDRSYVSSTSVAVALGRLAPELRTSRWQVWGPRESDYAVS